MDDVQQKRFDEFWQAYPKRVAKGDAKKAWLKLRPSKELLARIVKAIGEQKKSEQWRRDRGQFIPYPATWLRADRWEDEVEVKIVKQEVKTYQPPEYIPAKTGKPPHKMMTEDELRKRLADEMTTMFERNLIRRELDSRAKECANG